MCALTWEDFDPDAGTLTFTDTLAMEKTEAKDKKDKTVIKYLLVRRGHLKNGDETRTAHRPDWLSSRPKEMRQGSGAEIWGEHGGAPTMSQACLHRIAYSHDLRHYVGTKIAREPGVGSATQLGDTVRVAEAHYVTPAHSGPQEAASIP